MAKYIEVPAKEIRKWVSEQIDSGNFRLLSTISGYHEGENIYLLYHFLTKEDGELNVRTSVPVTNPVMSSISPVLIGAILYEREIQDILGVKFDDIPDGRRLILPETWPDNVYPLRKEYHSPREETYK